MRLFFVLVLTFGCVACKPNLWQKHLPLLEAKMEKLRQVDRDGIPSLTQDTLACQGPLVEVSSEGGNVIVASAGLLRHYGEGRLDRPAFPQEIVLDVVESWNQEKKVPSDYDPKEAEERIRTFLGIDKVFLIKTVVSEPPRRNGDRFTPGMFRGEAHLYDLQGKYYGGVRFEATNSEKVTYKKKIDQNGRILSDDAGSSLDVDLREQAWKAFIQAVTKKIPGAKFRDLP